MVSQREAPCRPCLLEGGEAASQKLSRLLHLVHTKGDGAQDMLRKSQFPLAAAFLSRGNAFGAVAVGRAVVRQLQGKRRRPEQCLAPQGIRAGRQFQCTLQPGQALAVVAMLAPEVAHG